MSKKKTFQGDPRTYIIIPIPGDSKHSKCKCLAKIRNSDGVICSCTYEARTDHIIEDIKKGKLHVCKPGKPIGSDISDFFKAPASNTGTDELTAKALQERLVTFIGRKNISMTVGASDELYDLLVYAFACGVKNGNKADPLGSGKAFLPHLKRPALTKLLIETADTVHRNTMHLFSADQMPYVAVAIDEGSTMSRKLLDFCLENPEYPIVSYPGTTVRMPNTTFEAYNHAILAGLQEMDSYHISFAALIIDGGTGQEKALNDDDPASLFNRTDIQWVQKLLVIPCVCHRVNNAFKRACSKEDNGINEMIDFVHSLPGRLNEHTRDIGATCPKHTSTRWTCDFFIADFVINHREKCSQFVDFPTEFDMFYEISVIFYALIQIFEDPKCSLSSVYPIIKDALEELDELNSKGNIFALIFKTSLFNYTLNSKDKGIWSLAYMLTPKGREESKSLLINSGYHATHRTVKKFYVKKTPTRDAIDEGIEEMVDETVTAISDIDPENVTDNDIGIPFVNAEKHIDPLPDGTVVEEIPEPSPEELERMLTSTRGSLQSAGIEYLKKALIKIKCPPNLIDNQVSMFKSFLYNNATPLPTRITLTQHVRFDWPLIRTDEDGKWRFLADLALRLESCTAAEASCERTITAQRLILTAHTLRSDKKLLEARLRFLKGFEK